MNSPSEGSIDLLRFVSAAEFDATEFPPQKLLVDAPIPILEAAATLLHGADDTLKSWAAQAAGIAAAKDGACTIFLTGEGGLEATQRRLRRLARGMGTNLTELGSNLLLHHGPHVLDDRAFRTLRHECRKWSTRLLIVDPLFTFFDGDENSARDVTRLLNEFTRLVVDGVAVLLIHHEGKATERGNRHARGSSAFSAWAHSRFQMRRTKSGVKLAHLKQKDGTRGPDATVELDVSADSARVLVSAAATAESRQCSKDRVLALLSGSPKIQSHVATAAGLSNANAKAILAELVAEGRAAKRSFTSTDSAGRARSQTGYCAADSNPPSSDAGALGISLRQLQEPHD